MNAGRKKLKIENKKIIQPVGSKPNKAGVGGEQNKAKDALHEAQEWFRAILYSIGDAVITTDKEGNIRQMNPVAEALTGWREAEAQGKNIGEVFRIVNEETRAEVENPVARVLREGVVVGLANHTLLIVRDGTERPIADSGAPIRDEKGAITGVVLVFRDQAAERAAQKALKESEETFRVLAENASDGIFITVGQGVQAYANKRAAEITGYSGAELLTTSIKDLIHPYELKKIMERYRIRLAGEYVPSQYETVIINKDGKSVPIELTAAKTIWKLQPADLVIIREITESKRMEELRKHHDELETLVAQRTQQLAGSEQCLAKESGAVATIMGEMLSGHLTDAEIERQVLNACLDATNSVYGMIGVVNQHGKYDVMTYNSRTLSDCAFPEALTWELSTGMDIRGIWGWPMLHDKPLICNDLHNHPDRVGQPKGHVPIESFLGVPVKHQGKVAGMMAVANKPGGYTQADMEILSRLVDVMAVSRQHRELLAEAQTTSAELEQRVRERTAQLESANKELEAFTYSVSHDLRAPLRAIDGYARILVEEFEPHLDAEGKRFCSIINESVRNMGKLIDDLLSFSRFSRAAMQPSSIDMKTLANSVFFELTTPESRQRIDFRVGSLPQAIGDPTLIRQVWMNLLSNAIKFSSREERVIIEVNGVGRGEENVYSVRDNGVGFDMQYVHKLFGVFQRLHSTREFEGTGVGLAIVQRIIHRHGGCVWGEGEVDKGAVFYFTLQQEGV